MPPGWFYKIVVQEKDDDINQLDKNHKSKNIKNILILVFIVFLVLSFYSLLYAGYDLTVCAIYNEHDLPYMREWVEFHEKQGVQHFYLYNHGSSKSWKEFLKDYEDRGLIEVIDWPYYYSDHKQWNKIQNAAYMNCVEKIRNSVKWCAFIDTDEFLFSTFYRNLIEGLKDYDDFSGLSVNWIWFGTSGIYQIPLGEKMTDLLVWKDSVTSKIIKTIAKPKYIKESYIHNFTYNHGYTVNENKLPTPRCDSDSFSINKFRINHYWARDLSFFIFTKIPRYELWGNDVNNFIEYEKTLNSIYDDTIKSFN